MISRSLSHLIRFTVVLAAVAVVAASTPAQIKKLVPLMGKGPADFQKAFGAPTKVVQGKGLRYLYYNVPGTLMVKCRDLGGKINWVWVHGYVGGDSPQQFVSKFGVKVGKPSNENIVNKKNTTWDWERPSPNVSRIFLQKTYNIPHLTELYARKDVPKDKWIYTSILYGATRRRSNAAGAGG